MGALSPLIRSPDWGAVKKGPLPFGRGPKRPGLESNQRLQTCRARRITILPPGRRHPALKGGVFCFEDFESIATLKAAQSRVKDLWRFHSQPPRYPHQAPTNGPIVTGYDLSLTG